MAAEERAPEQVAPDRVVDIEPNLVRVEVYRDRLEIWTIKRTIEAFIKGELGPGRAW